MIPGFNPFVPPPRFCRYHGERKYVKNIQKLFNPKTGNMYCLSVYYKCPKWFCVINCEENGTEYFNVPDVKQCPSA